MNGYMGKLVGVDCQGEQFEARPGVLRVARGYQGSGLAGDVRDICSVHKASRVEELMVDLGVVA